MKPGLVKKAADKLKQLDTFLGTNLWFAGDRVSLPASSEKCIFCTKLETQLIMI